MFCNWFYILIFVIDDHLEFMSFTRAGSASADASWKRPAGPRFPDSQETAGFRLGGGRTSNRLELREEDDVADDLGAGEEHDEAVEADAEAAGRRHAVFQRADEVLVDLLDVLARLHLEGLALLEGIVLLGVAGAEFLAVSGF